jgi:hypothetical protein
VSGNRAQRFQTQQLHLWWEPGSLYLASLKTRRNPALHYDLAIAHSLVEAMLASPPLAL